MIASVTVRGDNVEDDKKYKGDDDADDWMMTSS